MPGIAPGRTCRTDDVARPGAEGRGRAHVGQVPDLPGRALDDARVQRHGHDGDGDDGVDQARPEDGRHREGEQDAGEGQQQVDDPHDQEADRAAQVPGDEAERRPRRCRRVPPRPRWRRWCSGRRTAPAPRSTGRTGRCPSGGRKGQRRPEERHPGVLHVRAAPLITGASSTGMITRASRMTPMRKFLCRSSWDGREAGLSGRLTTATSTGTAAPRRPARARPTRSAGMGLTSLRFGDRAADRAGPRPGW